MTTVEKKPTDLTKIDTPAFLEKLHSALDKSTSGLKNSQNKINRYYYSVGSYSLLLEQNLKVENLTQIKTSQVPYLPEWHKGITSIRGIVMPVIDLHSFIQSQFKTKEKTNTNNKDYFLMIEHKNHNPVIIQIDKLPELVDIEKYKKTKMNKKLPSWVEHHLKQDNKTIMQVSHNELLKQLIYTQ